MTQQNTNTNVDMAELEFHRADLQALLVRAQDARYVGSMGDDFYFTNGGFDSATRLITQLEAQLRSVEAQLRSVEDADANRP
jgi:hypothetical protein